MFCQPTHLSKGRSVVPANPPTFQKMGGAAAFPRALFFAAREYLAAQQKTELPECEPNSSTIIQNVRFARIIFFATRKMSMPKERMLPSLTYANFQTLLSKAFFGQFAEMAMETSIAVHYVFSHIAQPRRFYSGWEHNMLFRHLCPGCSDIFFKRSWICGSTTVGPAIFVTTGRR